MTVVETYSEATFSREKVVLLLLNATGSQTGIRIYPLEFIIKITIQLMTKWRHIGLPKSLLTFLALEKLEEMMKSENSEARDNLKWNHCYFVFTEDVDFTCKTKRCVLLVLSSHLFV